MSSLFENAKNFIDREIRPMVQSDGGDIEVIELTHDKVLKVAFQGACTNCPSSSMTLAFGIEARVKEEFPEIQAVEQI
jgi:Fe-S cluster biogenesis protein NfuA